MSGAWVLKGTRMPVSAIFENLEAGANILSAFFSKTTFPDAESTTSSPH